MWKEIWEAAKGDLLWSSLRRKYRIGNNRTAIFLTSNRDWQDVTLRFLPEFMHYHACEDVVIFVEDKNSVDYLKKKAKGEFEIYLNPPRKLNSIIKYHCFCKINDCVIFMYPDKPYDNLAWLALRQEDISLEEIICLCFFKIRFVPEKDDV